MPSILHATSADAIAAGFRQQLLYLPFEQLNLAGPDQTHEIQGTLVREGVMVDTRTPEQVLQSIEEQGKIVDESLKTLRALLNA